MKGRMREMIEEGKTVRRWNVDYLPDLLTKIDQISTPPPECPPPLMIRCIRIIWYVVCKVGPKGNQIRPSMDGFVRIPPLICPFVDYGEPRIRTRIPCGEDEKKNTYFNILRLFGEPIDDATKPRVCLVWRGGRRSSTTFPSSPSPAFLLHSPKTVHCVWAMNRDNQLVY